MYNIYNQRVEETRNGITTKYVRDIRTDNILVELDNDNNPIYYYIYSPNGMLMARMKPNGDLHYYHGDIRGSVIMITDDNAEITHQYQYDDFGTVTKIFEPENDINRYRYVGIYGVEYDLNDLYYMRARYYKPSIGRFLTEDPIWSTNLYPYADNNPISRIDPYGEFYKEIIGIIAFTPLDADAPTLNENGEETIVNAEPKLDRDIVSILMLAVLSKGKSLKSNTSQISEGVWANFKRFYKKIPANSKANVTIRKTNQGYLFEAISPAKNIPGSQAVYQKVVNNNGRTMEYLKKVYDAMGNIINIKIK